MGTYFWLVVVVAVYTLAAVRPVRRGPLAVVSWMLGYLVNELPFVASYVLVAATLLTATQGGLESTAERVALGLAALTLLGLAEIVRRACLTRSVVEAALARDLGPGTQRHTAGPRLGAGRLARVLLVPLPLWPRGVRRVRNIAYGPAGGGHRLDLYERPGRTGPAPVLIHFHGGHFRTGAKSREARPLLHRFARRGWVSVSANYRLGEAGRFPRSMEDAKRVVAWVHRNADELGLDPSRVVVAGSSAGAHLASMIALTADEPDFQPGFEDVDTSVSAVVGLYGFYGSRAPAGALPSSPQQCVGPHAPPFLIAHGTDDTMTPLSSARDLADRLRASSPAPVVSLELPGAQHSFDLFHSLRFEWVVDAVEAFLEHSYPPPTPRPRPEVTA